MSFEQAALDILYDSELPADYPPIAMCAGCPLLCLQSVMKILEGRRYCITCATAREIT